MAIRLEKGSRISLAKEAPGLKNCMVGLGWDPVKQTGLLGLRKAPNIDCDAFAIPLHYGQLQNDIVYFGRTEHPSHAIRHGGDNLTGDGDGDDEVINIWLEQIPFDITEIAVGVNIYEGARRNQTFGKINNAFIRLVDRQTNQEICRYTLSKSAEYANEIAVMFGRFIRTPNEGWQFEALGIPVRGNSISEVARIYANR